ncbi:MAG TPA: hypothetical protein VE262_24490 [Blastocatellia bacterium]|nr:hypothetical protein [Blastocatellia bacterium]
MKPFTKICLLTLTLSLILQGGFAQNRKGQRMAAKQSKDSSASLAAKIKRFAPTEVTADLSKLEAGDRKAVDKIIQAAELLDPLYLRQVWSGNPALLAKLKADKSPEGRLRFHNFLMNMGPWDRLDKNEPFVEGAPHEKPHQANFYPDDMTRGEFEKWVAGLSEGEKARATGFFWTIRRGTDGKLRTVPYSVEYREFLEPAAKLLREASALTTNRTLKDFLSKRADAFLSNDYYASDVAWMDLDSPIDVTIGPYETYEDELFNYKAAFEAYVTIRDEAESDRLAKFSGHLQEIEDNLPIDPRYRNKKIGAAAPIRVVDEVFASGDGNRGVQTAAFNLPNDEKVVQEKGSKRVMIKNVQHAKFDKVLVPISNIVIAPADRKNISFDAFFTHILAHELVHGLGPQVIRVNGRETSVRQELKELSSAIEEAKADITGLFALQYLIDKGVVDRGLERTLYTTYLASSFRSVRFGITEAHGRGQALQFNYLVEKGAINVNEKAGTFSINPARIKEGVTSLTREILTLQAEGSYAKAKELLDKYAVIKPSMQKALDKLSGVPVDIEPKFPATKYSRAESLW